MMSLPMRRNSLKSSPNTLTASELCGSNTLSSTLSMIGWLKAISKPGSCVELRRHAADQILLGLAGRPGAVGREHRPPLPCARASKDRCRRRCGRYGSRRTTLRETRSRRGADRRPCRSLSAAKCRAAFRRAARSSLRRDPAGIRATPWRRGSTTATAAPAASR